jgi:mycothiol system anti-sigma-R factor
MTGDDAAAVAPGAEAGCGPNCEQALGRLFAYVDSELPADDAAQVRAHVEDCRPCLDEMAVETMLKELVKRCCQEQAPADLRLKIHARLTEIRVTRTV